MKIILLIFTTANDISNLAHCLLMAFSELEKRKHKIFLEKLRNIEQKPYGASLSANIQSGVRDSGFVTEQLSGN